MGMRREYGLFQQFQSISLSQRCLCVSQRIHLHISQDFPRQKVLANYTHYLDVWHMLFVVVWQCSSGRDSFFYLNHTDILLFAFCISDYWLILGNMSPKCPRNSSVSLALKQSAKISVVETSLFCSRSHWPSYPVECQRSLSGFSWCQKNKVVRVTFQIILLLGAVFSVSLHTFTEWSCHNTGTPSVRVSVLSMTINQIHLGVQRIGLCICISIPSGLKATYVNSWHTLTSVCTWKREGSIHIKMDRFKCQMFFK